MNKLREIGLLGLLARCSPHVDVDLRESIEMAMLDSDLVVSVEHRLDRLDFVTTSGLSSFEVGPADRFGPSLGVRNAEDYQT